MTRPSPADHPVTETLDCSGLLCPLPVYKASLALRNLAEGEVLQLITTDRGSLQDIPAMARQRGDTLVSSSEDGATQTFLIRRGAAT